MRIARIGILLALLCVLVATPAHAQYRRSPSDTLRLREVTAGVMTLTTPSGTIALRTEHDATMAVTFGGADSARAWYEALHIALVTPEGRQAPATRAALSRAFDLTFDARGRIRMLRAPEFPASFESVTDLSHQFDDLFVRLPSEPLMLGLVWEDTAVVETRGADDGFFRSERVLRSRVVRDTTIAGESAWAIAVVQRSTVASRQRVKGQPLTAESALTGIDSGTVIFSKEQGRMLARQRQGDLSGTITYVGGPQPVVLPMRQQFENEVHRLP